MKRYSPGAGTKSDYYYICDYCEEDDGRPVLVWYKLPERKGHFALCFECLEKLYHDNITTTELKGTFFIQRTIIPESLRNKIFERDGNKCMECGSTINLQIDHIIPFSRGGRTEENNLQTLCQKCNMKKGNG